MTKIKHAHLYRRVDIGKPLIKEGRVVGKKKYIIYRCLKPACTHTVIPELLEGKIAECSRCHEEFICDKSSKLLKEPHCSDCTQKRKPDAMESTLKFVEDLANDFK
jgi:hypothetical protein